VVETGFAQLPEDAYRKAYDAHTEGWTSELGELVDYLDAACLLHRVGLLRQRQPAELDHHR
jgi:hypothetical protein